MLTSDDSSDISWVWTDPDPVGWLIEESPDGLTGWVELETVSGADRTNGDVDAGQFTRVTGVDGAGAPVTQPSNVVFNG